jgi:pyrimidine-nucleoside phosphorylase
VALISDMNQPLGSAGGNALEVREALATLQGGGPRDFREHCLRVGAHMLILGGKSHDMAKARKRLVAVLADGSALAKFRGLVEAQGGDVRAIDDPSLLPSAPVVVDVASPRGGHLRRIDARTVGEVSVRLGAGRARKGDPIDHAVGIVVRAKVGDRIRVGDPLFTIHAKDALSASEVQGALLSGVEYSSRPVAPLPLFYRTLRS